MHIQLFTPENIIASVKIQNHTICSIIIFNYSIPGTKNTNFAEHNLT